MQEIVDDVKLETEDDVYFGYFNVHDTDKDGQTISDVLDLKFLTGS